MEHTKGNIIEKGMSLFHRKGYHNVGLNEILAAAEVPKGSFYYYFKSKEDFIIQVLQAYEEQSVAFMKQFLSDPAISPLNRIKKFFDTMAQVYVQKEFSEGCLLGNCSLELADLYPTIRSATDKGLNNFQEIFTRCIREGQALGEINPDEPAEELASFLVASWEGAMLRMKSQRSPLAFDGFRKYLYKILEA